LRWLPLRGSATFHGCRTTPWFLRQALWWQAVVGEAFLRQTFFEQTGITLPDKFHQPRCRSFASGFQLRRALLCFRAALFQIEQARRMLRTRLG
jgi:hypothetical protein